MRAVDGAAVAGGKLVELQTLLPRPTPTKDGKWIYAVLAAGAVGSACVVTSSDVLVEITRRYLGFVVARLPADFVAKACGEDCSYEKRLDLATRFTLLPIKYALFFAAFCVVLQPLIADIVRAVKLRGSFAHDGDDPSSHAPAAVLREALITFAALSVLIIPWRRPFGCGSLGSVYAFMSADPLYQHSSWHDRRVLGPWIAHVIGWRGPLYYFFSVALQILLIALIHLFMRRAFDRGARSLATASSNRSVWQRRAVVLSICTSSFIANGSEYPGYPDIAWYIVAMVPLLVEVHEVTMVALVALGLWSHEVSALVTIPLAYFLSTRRATLVSCGVFVAYVITWLATKGMSLQALAATHMVIGDKTAVQIFFEEPGRLVGGIAVGGKLLWLCVFAVIVDLLRRRAMRDGMALALLAFLPLTSLVVAVDTSRLVGGAFVGLLFAMAMIVSRPQVPRWFRFVTVANLFVPSFYVGVNCGIQYFPGLYGLVMRPFLGAWVK